MNLNTAFPARRALRIPHAMVAVLFALPALAWIARRHRAAAADKRRERGLCPVCAYDLRATPEGCPECGTAGRLGSRAIDGRGRPMTAVFWWLMEQGVGGVACLLAAISLSGAWLG